MRCSANEVLCRLVYTGETFEQLLRNGTWYESLAQYPHLFLTEFPQSPQENHTATSAMDINDILVKTIENQSFSLHKNPEKTIIAFEENGCVLFKGAILLDACKEVMNSCYRERGDERCRNEHGALRIQSIMAGIIREITLNEIRIILSSQDKADTTDRLSRISFLTNTSHFLSFHR